MFSAQANREWERNYDSAQLMVILNNTEADLQMNQQGQLSPEQRRRLEREHESWTREKYIAGGVLLLLIAYGIFGGAKIGDSSGVGIVIGIMAVLYILEAAAGQRNISADLSDGTVKSVEGDIQRFRYSRRARYTGCGSRISGCRFHNLFTSCCARMHATSSTTPRNQNG